MITDPAISRVLLIGSDAEFHRHIEKYLLDKYECLHATDKKEGLLLARTHRPEAIILGALKPAGTSFTLHQQLRRGWITKYIPLLVVDYIGGVSKQSSWSREEAMQMDAEDYFLVAPDDEDAAKRLAGTLELVERLQNRVLARQNWFRESVQDTTTFCRTWEQIPGRGAFEMQHEKVIDNVARAADGGLIHAISVTDNPGGNPALSTEMLCAAIRKGGMEALVHLACRDKNRNELESMLYGLAAEDVRNVLILSGDFTAATAHSGRPKPVFDVDPVQTLQMIEEMNRGLEHVVLNRKTVLAPTEIFAGACISPFKSLESELIPQYYKLKKKIEAGAQFLITQVGFDARKFHELLVWLKTNQFDIPCFANIYILGKGAATLMNSGGVPGCAVSDSLLSQIAEESKADDKGREARLLRASRMYALAKGMGYAGAHIGGHGITYSMVQRIVEQGEELSSNWQDLIEEFEYPQTDGFYLFEKNPANLLNTEVSTKIGKKRRVPIMYRISRLAHVLLFNPKSFIFALMLPFARLIDHMPRIRRLFHFVEHVSKVVLFDCMNCGDCALFDVAFLCPMSQCPKQQRNGPCGGSSNGFCEVYPEEQQCVWVRAYNRLRAFDEEKSITEWKVPACNWELARTSSWLNFYLGRDHTAKRLQIPERN